MVSATHRFRGFLWTGSSLGAQAVMRLVTVALLARLLPPADFGVAEATAVAIGLAAVLGDLGLSAALVQQPVLERRHLRAATAVLLAVSVALMATTLLVAAPVARLLHLPELAQTLPIQSLALVLAAAGVVPEALLQRDLRLGELARAELTAHLVGHLIVSVVLAWAGFGYWSLVLAHLAQVGLRSLLLLLHQPWRLEREPVAGAPGHPENPGGDPGRPSWRQGWPLWRWSWPLWDRASVRELASFGGAWTAIRVANHLGAYGDDLVVGRRLGASAMGLYGRASQWMRSPTSMLSTALDRVMFPVLARARHDLPGLQHAFRRGHVVVGLIMLPASVLLLVFAPAVVRLALGPAWLDAVLPLQILAPALALRTSFKLSDTLARATGRVGASAWRHGVYGVLVCVAAAVGTSVGLYGVALGVVTVIGLQCALMADLSRRITGLSWSELAATLVPGGVVALLVAAAWLAARGLGALVGAGDLAQVALDAAAVLVAALGLLRKPALRGPLGDDAEWALALVHQHLPGWAGHWLALRPAAPPPPRPGRAGAGEAR